MKWWLGFFARAALLIVSMAVGIATALFALIGAPPPRQITFLELVLMFTQMLGGGGLVLFGIFTFSAWLARAHHVRW